MLAAPEFTNVVYVYGRQQEVLETNRIVYTDVRPTWVERLTELEELLPEQSEFKWTLGRVIQDAL